MADEYVKELRHSACGLSLREHQIDGLKTILHWFQDKHGGIVADEMGLGKTCQAVAAIACLLSRDRAGRHLVICPLSVIEHWQNELQRFGIGKIHLVKYIGNADQREAIREMLRTDKKWNVMLTTYEMLIREEQYFKRIWSTVFVDEAHRLKSNKSILHKIIHKMHVEFTVLLTGTPVQNNLNELYSLLSVIDSKIFPLEGEDQFIAKYRNTADRKVTDELQQLLSKYMFRRTKEMLSIGIPDSSELIIYHRITEIQKNLYLATLTKNYEFFESMDVRKTQTSGSKMSLLNILMQLRKCVAHPYLFDGVEPEPFEEGNHLFEVSGKFFLLDRLLAFLHQKGHRYSYQRLDGSVRAEERFAAINRFQGDPETFCFLLSTRAGGLGLNLTGADTVIFLDSDFNPQNDIQAAARCHRIGQTK
ncbi:unnamed protein product [Gongylonema pulchrum]|uniref:Helicase ATP-binding domain-containing protein n=1 Tax=Gongylonema pulchrum TaxID=637853 RepID=A0A183E754_9BILA|nr:unnamed protein product [Gongylonema pulchrum]